MLARVRKFVTALAGVVISLLLTRYGHSDQVVNAIVLLATAVGVYAVPNSGQAK